MQYVTNISGKPIEISLTRSASKALASATIPVLVEMELYFSCLIRKRVLFPAFNNQSAALPVAENLYVQFRPVMTRHCGLDPDGGPPPLADFPIEDIRPFVPRWLRLDFRRGHWWGEFGY